MEIWQKWLAGQLGKVEHPKHSPQPRSTSRWDTLYSWRTKIIIALTLLVWDTENPKLSGNSSISFFITVDLPEPEGPQRTRGPDPGIASLLLK